MPDLIALLREADRVPAPDLWTDIERRPPRRVAPEPSFGRRLAVAALALAFATGGVVVATRAFFGEPASDRPADEAADVHPRVTAMIPVGPFPTGLAAGEGSVWVGVPGQGGCADAGEVVRIDQTTNQVIARVPVDGWPTNIAVGFGSVWVEGLACRGTEEGVWRLDPRTNQVVDTLPVGAGTADIAVGEGSVWVTRGTGQEKNGDWEGEVVRIDPATNGVIARIPFSGGPRDVVVGAGGVWVLNMLPPPGRESLSGMELIHIDPATGQVIGRIPDVLSIGAGEGSAWASVWTDRSETGLVRIDPRTDEIMGDPIPRDFRGFAGEHNTIGTFPVGEGGMWFWTFPDRPITGFFQDHGRIHRLNAVTLEQDASVAPGSDRDWIDAALDPETHTLWLSHLRDQVTRIDLR